MAEETPFNDIELVSLLKKYNVLKILVVTSNDYYSKQYQIFFTLKGSSKMITLAHSSTII